MRAQDLFLLSARFCRKGRTSLKSFAWRAFGRARPAAIREDEDAIRSELFSIERLEQHAQSLATSQTRPCRADRGQVARRPPARQRARLAGGLSLDRHGRRCRPHDHTGRGMAFGQFPSRRAAGPREVRTDLPQGYYRQLPKLSEGPLAGYPRVFGLAWAFVAHTDSRFDPETLTRFVRAYQTVQPLSIGELWAVAITLRIVLSRICAARPAASSIDARPASRPTSLPIACWG